MGSLTMNFIILTSLLLLSLELTQGTTTPVFDPDIERAWKCAKQCDSSPLCVQGCCREHGVDDKICYSEMCAKSSDQCTTAEAIKCFETCCEHYTLVDEDCKDKIIII